ncbi:MAG TPA: ABC transporter permease, partial [Gemmatimonadales bacterium]|nr:ABC transporter permease [Gemmatimonadales bacterium]
STMARQGENQTVVLSYGLWQTQFGGDPRVLGSTVRLDGNPHVVIGIMPRGFNFPSPGTQFWLPLILDQESFADRQNTYLQGIGRLKPGRSFEQGRTDLDLIFTRLSKDHPESNAETGFSYFKLRDELLPRYRVMLLALCGASLSLLLLTGANLANLLLVRASNRERELAVRTALGAGRERLVRQMLTESLTLALLGGVAGVVVAALAVPLLTQLVPTSLPFDAQPHLDLRALGIAGVFTALTGILFGLLPALRVGKTASDALREGSRGGGGRRQRIRTVLVTAEVAISVALLVSAGFLIRAVLRVEAVDPGFDARGVLTLRTSLPTPRYDDPVLRAEFYRRVLSEVRVLPGVERAAYTSGLPMVLTGGIAGVEVPGYPVQGRRQEGVSWRLITPQFFASLAIPVLQGRDFEEADGPSRPLVVVVSESFVTRYWPGRNPLGLSFRVRDQDRTVVGVVRDIRVRGLERSNEPQVYVPYRQPPDGVGGLYQPKDLVLRTDGRSGNLFPAIREIIRRVDAEQPISDVRPLREVVELQTATRRTQLQVLGALALVALVLTGIGIYGLLAFLVAQRAREIGVRLALGAEPRRVAGMIVGEAGRWALAGCLAGAGIAYLAARAMSALLFGLGPADPVTFGAGIGVVALVTLAGALVPALRAVRISPLLAMRAE